ncbi:GNAT family N-acetyltransferase [Tuwongella immobilis]|uniref:N-acetyltransferase domain-containing protein n=1 Tax=Tuwongella immobilis TaxID=692036 RepID=A0A6C2YS66_9BACT|nr:GNAT family N-acetyltransferase [Tuwongella immobilis]VIP03722.1 toxin-antitoxin toxin gnat family : Acetyltransferase OS=Singulisphaera acidiphila (strain ATCC BAA-1392 / DSM 18658 / VKM B-2454 / MOB10) GN=Sinac_7159 PE=4 SV=1: Acetyltransf_7 [Tuwongella immobilis]VTS04812.1 toxin-antitoxin toxin gnat family : Acetyltransferase OS=Singulisphaera acidiphila (strain ATCC BAA-1392 / DSM 18658 / VKM B-2454 / MOB10) GN=Sinac_7159 PE=4 SV=1: Acetyltransf_7 [Tuwongella immobilis]
MADWTIEPFDKEHDRAAFACGRSTLDDFIRVRVSQYEKRRLGKTFVAVPPGEKRVIGYYTLAAGAVAFERMPVDATRKLPKHPVPVVLLARLAVDQTAQGQRLGEGLLLDALQRTLDLSADLGVHAVEVDAIDDTAAAFYRKYGFVPLLDEPLHLYLPLTTVEQVLA